MQIHYLSKIPINIEVFSDFCVNELGWSGGKKADADEYFYTFALNRFDTAWVRMRQYGEFIQATEGSCIDDYLLPMFATPADMEEFLYCRELHLESKRGRTEAGSAIPPF